MYVINDIERTLFPVACSGCDSKLISNEDLICTNCLLNLPFTNWHKHHKNRFYNSIYHRIRINKASSLVFYHKKSEVQRIIHALKYKNMPKIGTFLGDILGRKFMEVNWVDEFDVILPIPLHPKKLKLRGYNQSNFIAQGIAKKTHLPIDTKSLSRIEYSSSQTIKNRIERWLNMEKVFDCKPFKYNSILLIDDVITTGSTLEASANAILKTNPNCKIGIATIAFAE